MRIIALVSLVLFVGGCDRPSTESRIPKIAQAYCECAAPLVALNRQAARLAADTTAQAAFQENLKKIQDEYARVKECSATIIGQYGRLKKEEYNQVKKALDTQCPELAAQYDLLREMLGE